MIQLELARAIWYVQISPDQDYMGALTVSDDGVMRFVFRIRSYVTPDNAWDDKNRKDWYHAVILGHSLDSAIHEVRRLVNGLGLTSGASSRGEVFELLRGDMSIDEFAAVLQSQPFVHIKSSQ